MVKSSIAVVVWCVLVADVLPAQVQSSFEEMYPPPPGFVLVDDEWLPADVVYGDSVYTPDPWPNGDVRYRFSVFITPVQQNLFRDYVKELECVCGINFIEDTNSSASDYILIVPSSDPGVSSSPVGYQGGLQTLRIWPGNATAATHWTSRFLIIHEMMHALGYRHEQTRTDRDFFVTINWNNIPSNRHHNFEILTILEQPTMVGLYDFDSIMHYGSCAFSSCDTFLPTCVGPSGTTPTPNCWTITTLDPAMQVRIGNRTYLSDGDVAGLQAAYGGTPVWPSITSVAPPEVPYNQATTLTITGENFYLRSTATGTGEQGSFVKVNGVDLSAQTTYVDRNTLTVTVPAWLTVSNACLEVVVNNEYFGDSMPEEIGVTPGGTSATLFPGSAPYSEAGYKREPGRYQQHSFSTRDVFVRGHWSDECTVIERSPGEASGGSGRNPTSCYQFRT
ncbi:MAG: hypothetical protein CMJ83_17610 [Planctomycetes bacterium]|nr:hypothetical protein [Planctomycetota bacterium]